LGNGIAKRQNEKNNLNKLAAQRRLYSEVKIMMTIEIFAILLIIIVAIMLNLISDNFLNKLHISRVLLLEIFTIGNFVFTFIGIAFLHPAMISKKESAAKIQESFDCDVLLLPWNELIAGQCIDDELIFSIANKLKNKSTLKNWYSPLVEQLPLSIARIICQRTNCWWDSHIRETFKNSLMLVAIIIPIILFALALFYGMTLFKFIALVLAPFLPALVFIVKNYQENSGAIENLNKLKQKAEKTWEEALESKDDCKLTNLSRSFQDLIFENRKRNPLVFDWFYWLLRDSQSKSMDYSTKVMIGEFHETM
jgi:hypothetical protein